MSIFNIHKNKSEASSLPDNLQTEVSKLQVIINTVEDGIILLDNQRVIQFINPSAAIICGWKAEEATGINVSNVLQLVTDKGELISDEVNPLIQVFKGEKTLHAEDAIILNRDKQQIPTDLKISPLLDKDRQVTAAVIVFNNVSKARVEERQRADFISTASHEMRTPVAAIEGYLALALNDRVSTIDSRARDYLEKAHSSTQHLGKLFQDLLTSAKAEDGRLTSHPSVIEMGSFLEQLSDDFRLIAKKKGLTLDFTVGSTTAVINATSEQGGQRVIKPLYYVYADPDRLREVITNIFDNAVKYTSEGKVSLGLTGNERVVQCNVRDTGPGIPAADLPHLFQKFYRVDNSVTRTVGGTGLGLFICRKIVELYNGRIWAESKLDEGSTFYINLPRLTTKKATELQNSVLQ